jgi:simple sugar transport system ATP-binding protein
MTALRSGHPLSAGVPQQALGLEALSMTKHFGAFTALDKVSLKVPAGSFHALLGENGAGKSTLVKCIMGYYRADDGELIIGDRQEVVDNPQTAHALGLSMVYQHFTSVPAMTVTENFVLARPQLPPIIDWKKEKAQLEAFLDHMPFRLPLDAKVSAISAGERQKCEILKQLYLKRRFLILDEPTSVLTPGEADEVLGMLRQMAVRSEITVLLITHKFREVIAFADEVTILRRGRLAGKGRVAALSSEAMAGMMIGAETLTKQPARTGKFGTPRLEINSLRALDDSGELALNEVSLSVRAGEIVGIAGVSGNGQKQLVEVLAGQRAASGGEILIAGTAYRATREEMHRHKLSCLPEEPLRNACVGRMSVAENLAFRDFDRAPFAAAGGWLKRKAFRDLAKRKIADYGIKTRSADSRLDELSGGNVQRTVLARELGGAVDVMIAANPCFGLDFAAVAQIRAEIMAVRNRSAAVLLVSEDLDELLELADRIVVIFNGRFVYEARAGEVDLVEIGRHMAGHAQINDDDARTSSRGKGGPVAELSADRP